MGSRQHWICLVAAVYIPPGDERRSSSRPQIAEEVVSLFQFLLFKTTMKGGHKEVAATLSVHSAFVGGVQANISVVVTCRNMDTCVYFLFQCLLHQPSMFNAIEPNCNNVEISTSILVIQKMNLYPSKQHTMDDFA